MANATKPQSSPMPSRDKVRAHRARLRAQGLRPVTLWLPDVTSPEFKAEASRQSLAAANSPQAADDQAFIDSVSIFWDEDFWKNEDHGFDE